MANTLELQSLFNNGMKQDQPREQMQKGASWNMQDLIPETGAPLRKRGGWTRPFSAFGTGGTYAAGVGFGAFASGSQVVGYDNSGNLVAISNLSSTPTLATKGTVSVGAAQPIFYRNQLYFPDIAGTATPKYYDGSASAAAVAGAPAGAVGTVYKDHLVLARSAANTNRIWFASAGTPGTWDTAADGQWLDTTYPIQGIIATSNLIMVFGEGFTERVRGDIIPGVQGSDFVKEPLWPIGCSDPASIALWDGLVIFANSTGVYASDGSTVVIDITQQGGIKQLWLSTLASYSSTYTLAAAVFRNRYHITIMNGSTFVDSFVCDLPNRIWWRNRNLDTIMMAATPVGLYDVSPTLYMAERGALHVANLGPMYTPTASNKADGDSDAVIWSLESPHFKAKSGLKRWRHFWLSCDIRDAASDNPVITAAYATDPSATSYTNLSPTIAEGTEYQRVRVPIGGKKAEGMQFKLSQTNASSDTRLYALEAELHQLEQVQAQLVAEQDLTEHERQLILKFAANPLDFFSGETRGWLEDFIHLSGPTGITAGSGNGSTGLGLAYYVPGDLKTVMVDLSAQTGEYVYEDDSGNWLYLNGVAVSQTTYAALYAHVGANAFGTDSGGNFSLPDCRSRALYFCGTHADADLGDSDGVTLASRRPKHQHSVSITGATSSDSAGTPAGTVAITDPGHLHAIASVFDQTNGNGNLQRGLTGNAGSNNTNSNTTGITASFTGSALSGHAHTLTGSGTAGSGMALDAPPYLHIGSLVVRF